LRTHALTESVHDRLLADGGLPLLMIA
jgi:hypothetical protein